MDELAVFKVHQTLCALDVACVQEVCRHWSLTKVWGVSPKVLGVINLRGKIVTVLDLAAILELPSSMRKELVIIEHEKEEIALAVDSVETVVKWPSASSAQAGALHRAFSQVVQIQNELVCVLDLKQVRRYD